MILHYLKTAFRQILIHKVQYILCVVGIAIGMLCFSITAYYVRRYNSQFNAWEQADRIAKVQVRSTNESGAHMRIPGKELDLLLKNPVAGIERIANCEGYDKANITFIKEKEGGVPFHCSFNKIVPDYISIYDLRTVQGQVPSLKAGEVLISESCARKVYPNENPVGKILYFSHADTDTSAVHYCTVRAVINDLPEGTEAKADLYFFNVDPIDFGKTYWDISVLLAEGVSSKEVNKRLRQQYPLFGANADNYLFVQTLTEKSMEPENILIALLIPLIGAFILIIAMINFLKLCIYSFYSRTRELSLRKSLGSGIGGLFILLFCEISILLAFAMIAVFAVTELFVPFYYLLLPESMGSNPVVQIDTAVLLRQQLEYLLLLYLLCGSICLLIVYRIGYKNVITGVRGGNTRKQHVRNFVLGSQLFICFLFVGGTVGMNMINRKLAEVRNNTLTEEEGRQIWKMSLWEPQLQGHKSELMAEILGLSGVEDVLKQAERQSVEYKTAQNEILYGEARAVSENYRSFMNQTMQGRMPRNDSEIAVSRSLIWQMEKDGLDGQFVQLGDKSYQITGVYEALPFRTVLTKQQTERATSFFHFSLISPVKNSFENEFYVKCVPGQEQKVKKEIVRLVRTHLPASIPFNLISIEEEQFLDDGGGGVILCRLFTVLSIISILITILGIYSAITLDTQSRQKEVALRKISGATSQDIYRLFGNLYIRLLVISGIPALIAVYAVLSITVTRIPVPVGWLNNPALWLGIFLLVSLLVILTVAYRILLISKINPAEIIKTE